uniref:Uncharacterized protein n=1 Tax=Zea mays TaxID=4577 RepID=A0A804NJQ4_MAIZE
MVLTPPPSHAAIPAVRIPGWWSEAITSDRGSCASLLSGISVALDQRISRRRPFLLWNPLTTVGRAAATPEAEPPHRNSQARLFQPPTPHPPPRRSLSPPHSLDPPRGAQSPPRGPKTRSSAFLHRRLIVPGLAQMQTAASFGYAAGRGPRKRATTTSPPPPPPPPPPPHRSPPWPWLGWPPGDLSSLPQTTPPSPRISFSFSPFQTFRSRRCQPPFARRVSRRSSRRILTCLHRAKESRWLCALAPLLGGHHRPSTTQWVPSSH